MHFQSSILLLAASMLLQTVVGADPVVVESVRLTGWEGCSAAWQRQINDAWVSALEIANVVGSPINFQGVPENEFLGPASLNKAAQDDIQSMQSFKPVSIA